MILAGHIFYILSIFATYLIIKNTNYALGVKKDWSDFQHINFVYHRNIINNDFLVKILGFSLE